MLLPMGLCFGVSAFALLGGAVWAFVKQQRAMSGRTVSTGTVVELTSRITASGRANIICPVVEFTVPSGEKIQFTSDFESLPAKHDIGQSVDVRYDLMHPQQAEIDSVMNVWLTPLILAFMSVIARCLTVAFLTVYAMGGLSFSP